MFMEKTIWYFESKGDNGRVANGLSVDSMLRVSNRFIAPQWDSIPYQGNTEFEKWDNIDYHQSFKMTKKYNILTLWISSQMNPNWTIRWGSLL